MELERRQVLLLSFQNLRNNKLKLLGIEMDFRSKCLFGI